MASFFVLKGEDETQKKKNQHQNDAIARAEETPTWSSLQNKWENHNSKKYTTALDIPVSCFRLSCWLVSRQFMFLFKYFVSLFLFQTCLHISKYDFLRFPFLSNQLRTVIVN